uniref:Uncharacterized protein n=1 Tax=Panagrolaimus sp. JU765 TaxID=591449 RepID=A0AC34QXZ9_9BILA
MNNCLLGFCLLTSLLLVVIGYAVFFFFFPKIGSIITIVCHSLLILIPLIGLPPFFKYDPELADDSLYWKAFSCPVLIYQISASCVLVFVSWNIFIHPGDVDCTKTKGVYPDCYLVLICTILIFFTSLFTKKDRHFQQCLHLFSITVTNHPMAFLIISSSFHVVCLVIHSILLTGLIFKKIAKIRAKLLPIIFVCCLWIIHVIISGYGIITAKNKLTDSWVLIDDELSDIDILPIQLAVFGGILIIFTSLPLVILGYGNKGLFRIKKSQNSNNIRPPLRKETESDVIANYRIELF